ncbi:MAG: hypothetical protein GZ091_16230 [Paludibacter sp.]|nr:hypothetical protein [Paludibacter sp.]
MQPVKGLKIESFPVKGLYKIDNLIYFDGPLLSFYTNDDGDNYLYYWVDVDDFCNRWMVFPVELAELNDYLNEKTTLYSLINRSLTGYVLDLDDNLEAVNTFLIQISDLPEDYLPEIKSIYNCEKTSEEVFLKYYSKKHKKGILQTHFSGGNEIGYGTMDLHLFSKLMNNFTDLNDGLGNSFYKIEKKKQEFRKKGNKENKEKSIKKIEFQNAYKFDVLSTRAASFSILLKPVDEEIGFEGTPTRADKYIEFMSEFISGSKTLDTLKNYAQQIDISTINHYESFLKLVEESHSKFQIGYLNVVSKSAYSNQIDANQAKKIITNLQTLDFESDETLSITGKFIALNIKAGKYTFESSEDKSTGTLRGDALKKCFEIAFNKTYQVEIQRKTTKKAAIKKSKNIDILKLIVEIKNAQQEIENEFA